MELLKVGQLFAGRYRVQRRLAEGGMGAVYVALQEATELEVALKVLWPHVLQRSEAMDRFALEAKIAARIRSDHIVQVFDAGFDTTSQMPFLVMELLQGVTLQKLIEMGGPCAHTEVIELLAQTARALDRAHAYKDANGQTAPVVHRDLKPDNIFITRRETGEPLVKILDYGIAKILSQSTALSREVKGTPLYMAYEQAAGAPVSPQTDIWALGLIAFYMLTGASYWCAPRTPGSDLSSLINEIVVLPIVAPSQRVSELPTPRSLPAGFDAWFLRCVNRNPAARFASAGEAVQNLARALSTSVPLVNSVTPWVFDSTLIPQSRVARVINSAQQDAALGVTPGATPAVDASRVGGTQDNTMSPASVTQAPAPAPAKRPFAMVAAVSVTVLGIVAGFLLKGSPSESPDTTNATGTIATATPTAAQSAGPAPEEATLKGLLRIEPATAIVKVDGETKVVSDGTVELSGRRDRVFEIDLSVGAHHQTTQVTLLGNGAVEPSLVQLALPTSEPIAPVVHPVSHVQATPIASAKPAEQQPAPTTHPVTPVKPATAKSSTPYNPLMGPRGVR